MTAVSQRQFTALSGSAGPQRVQVNPRPEPSAAMGRKHTWSAI